MDQSMLEQWAAHVQQATQNMQLMIKTSASQLQEFQVSGETASTIADSVREMSWQNILDFSNSQILDARRAVDALKAAELQGADAMQHILEEAGRWPVDLEPIDTSAQNLVRVVGQSVDGTLQVGPKLAGDTLQVVGETVSAPAAELASTAESVVPQVEALAPTVESVVSSVQSALPAAESVVPVIEENAPVIAAAGTAAVTTAVTTTGTGGFGSAIAAVASGVPGGPVGLAIGAGVALAVLAGAWWYAHQGSGQTTENSPTTTAPATSLDGHWVLVSGLQNPYIDMGISCSHICDGPGRKLTIDQSSVTIDISGTKVTGGTYKTGFSSTLGNPCTIFESRVDATVSGGVDPTKADGQLIIDGTEVRKDSCDSNLQQTVTKTAFHTSRFFFLKDDTLFLCYNIDPNTFDACTTTGLSLTPQELPSGTSATFKRG